MLRTYRTTTFLFLFASALLAQKPFQNGQAARAVLGQLTFTKGDQNSSVQVLGGAGGVAWAANHLYVADSNRVAAAPNNHRVLMFNTTLIPGVTTDITQDSDVSILTSCHVCGTGALLTLGQDGFAPPTYTPAGKTASTTAFYSGYNGGQDPAGSSPVEHAWFYNATAVASDGGHFAVADTDNNRVLIWNSLPTFNNQHPDLVVGQPDLNTLQQQQLGVVNATSMRGPQGVWIKNGKLFVADTQNYRVLIWNTFPTRNNQPPDVVLGQPDFTHANGPPPSKIAPTAAANQLLNPVSVTSDNGHIFVSDLGFNRVLIWNTTNPSTYQNADVVVGQVDFAQSSSNNSTVCTNQTTGTSGQCASSLNFPRFALSDGTRLFVADGGNDRVLIFNTIPTSNGALANNLLGQTTFTNDIITSAAISIVSTQIDNTGAVDTTPTPTSLAWDGTNLYVADPYNRRVLVFTAGDSLIPSASDPTATVVPVVNWASEIVRQEGTVVFNVVSGGKITANDTATITIQSKAYAYTEKSTDTVDGIAKALAKLINASDPNVTATFAGAGTGAVYLSSQQTNLGYDTITLAAATSNSTNVVATASGSYLSAGNAATASPGALIEVNAPPGVTFTDSNTTLIAPLTGTVPNTLGGTQLYLDGFASPLYKVSKTQLVGQIPYFYSDRNSTSVYVRTVHNDGSITVTNATPVYIATANPGIFNAPQYINQKRPWPVAMAYHQLNNPTAVVSVDGSVHAADTATITIGSASYTYTVLSTDTLATITSSLVTLINATDTSVTASLGGAFTRVVLTSKLDGFSGGNGIAVAATTSTGASVTLTAYTSSTCCAVRNGTLIFPGNPAVAGEMISISASGLGDIQDRSSNDLSTSLVTGAAYNGVAPPDNDVLSANFVAATMGAETAQVIFAGFPVGSYGTYRVDLIVPSDAPANDTTPLYIAQNAFVSNTVTVSVGAAVSNPPPAPTPIAPSPINLNIDSPTDGTNVAGSFQVFGWAIDSSSPVSSVAVQVDGVTVGYATYGVVRWDVCVAFPSSLSCPNVGFTYTLNTFSVANGTHTVGIVVTDTAGRHLSYSQSNITVFNDPAAYPTHVVIDTPATFSIFAYHGLVNFAGWALNETSPITTLKAYIDGAPVQISYGASRPDVCAAYPGRPGCPNVGWTLLADLTKLANATHTFTLTAIAANGQQFTTANTFTVNNYTNNSLLAGPTLAIDTPSTSAGTLSGTIVISGWALDPFTSIASVQVSVDGVLFGNANAGIVRNDVCAATTYAGAPGCPNVGWNGNLDTTLLSDGTHSLGFIVTPMSGQAYTGTRQITVGNLNTSANPVRIAIDSPAQTLPTLSGVSPINGWAISDTAAMQTITVSVDGVSIGTATYGGPRPDVCAAFPGRAGCPNVGWNYSLDTTRLTNGVHMLEITGTSTAGKRATTSVAFNVSNSALSARTVIDVPAINSNPFTGIALLHGWALKDTAAIVSVSVTVDGVLNGSAVYGVLRPDVCVAYPGRPGCPNVGWTYALDTSTLVDGTHTLGVTATAADGTSNTTSISFTIANWTTLATPPITIVIDVPGGRVKVPLNGSLTFYGWALKQNESIASVLISIDGVPFGNATRAYRPDVCAVNSSPDCPNTGWSFQLDTGYLTNDVHTLTVTAITASGQSVASSQLFSTAN